MSDHEYMPSMNPDDQGDCAICGNSQRMHPTPAATITQLRADLDAANERAEKAEAFIRNDADWKFSAKRRLALFREQRKRAETAEADAAALREALTLADAALSGANMDMKHVWRKIRAALTPSAPDEKTK